MTQGIDYAWDGPSPALVAASGYSFACRYLSYDTTGKNLTAGEAQALHAAGVDTVSNWEYAADAALGGYSQGVTDAQNAAAQHEQCGGPPDRPIYFSVDFDATEAQQAAINSYMDGVASVIGRNRAGAYGDYYVVKRLFDAGKITWGWQTYAWSGGQWDDRAQLRQVQNDITVGGASVDLNQAMADDFGQWGTGGDMANSDDILLLVQNMRENDRGTVTLSNGAVTGNGVKAWMDGADVKLAALQAAVGALGTAIGNAGGSVDAAAINTHVDAAVAPLASALAATRTELDAAKAEIDQLRAAAAAAASAESSALGK